MQLRSLTELDGSAGTVQLHSVYNSDTLILHPTPNPDDPNDPLRWQRYKKHICFVCVCIFAFLTNFAIGGLAPAFYILSIEFNKSQTQTSQLLSWPVFTLGLFNFFWVPLANYFGKRPVFLLASLLLALCCLWGALAQDFETLLWSNITAAFAGSSTEALGSAIVNDLYFLHERSHMMSIYIIFVAGGNCIGPLICGFIVTSLTWRWYKWICAILIFVNFILVLLFVPETRYQRSKTAFDASSPASVPSEGNEDVDKVGSSTLITAHPNPSRGRNSRTQQLAVFSGTPKDTNLFKLFLRPFPLIVYPAVLLAFVGYAVSLAWVIMINVLNPFVLQAPPYNWTPAINGLINIPGLLGNIIGCFLGGWVVDRYSSWRSKRNQGVFEPETRLHLLVIPTVVVAAGCLVFGYGVEERLKWASLFVGYGMVSVGLTAVPIMTLVYVSDSCLPINADALLLVNGLKNIAAFCFLYGVLPWITEVGYIDAFGTQAGVYVLLMLPVIPLVLYGRKIRHTTAQWHIIL